MKGHSKVVVNLMGNQHVEGGGLGVGDGLKGQKGAEFRDEALGDNPAEDGEGETTGESGKGKVGDEVIEA